MACKLSALAVPGDERCFKYRVKQNNPTCKRCDEWSGQGSPVAPAEPVADTTAPAKPARKKPKVVSTRRVKGQASKTAVPLVMKNEGSGVVEKPLDLKGAAALSDRMADVLDSLESAGVAGPLPESQLTDSNGAPPASDRDPRVTFECPHCGCVLSSAEVEAPNCPSPSCEKMLHTHLEQDGTVFTPGDACGVCGVYPCCCFDEEFTGATFGKVTNINSDQASIGVDPVIVLAIDEALSELKTAWLVDLSGLSPGRMVCETFRRLEALQSFRQMI